MFTKAEEIGPGMYVYRDVIKKELNIIDRLEHALSGRDPNYNWLPAYVGYQELMPDYRDCNDFKFKKTDIERDRGAVSLELQQIWQDCYDERSLP